MDSSTIYYGITDPPTAQLRICQPSTSRWWFRNVSTHLKKSSGEQTTLQHVGSNTRMAKRCLTEKNPKEKKNSTSNSNPNNPSLLSLEKICFKELSCSSRDISSSTLWRSSHWALAIKTSSLAWAKFVPQLVENNLLFGGKLHWKMEKNDISTTQKESLPGMFCLDLVLNIWDLLPKTERRFFPTRSWKSLLCCFLGVGEHADKDPQKEAPRCLNNGTKMLPSLCYRYDWNLNCFKYLGWLQIIRTSNRKCSIWIFQGMILSHSIHVWYIYLHLVDFYGKWM